MGRANSARSASLVNGRPPTARKPSASLSAKATRTLIRSHHQLHKALDAAKRSSNEVEAAKLQRQIDKKGGLQSYQKASILGQSQERGGDSSKVLLHWLDDLDGTATAEKHHMLEVGALSTSNACSRSELFEVVRIDLQSQADGILEQDFMQRPLPQSDAERFDVLSLSLVLNFVPDAAGRGDMLRRTCEFLQVRRKAQTATGRKAWFPALFLVLPVPCVENSRYMDEDRLKAIMSCIGYVQIKRKRSAKLLYSLWHWQGGNAVQKKLFAKLEVNPGKQRNNFCVVLR